MDNLLSNFKIEVPTGIYLKDPELIYNIIS